MRVCVHMNIQTHTLLVDPRFWNLDKSMATKHVDHMETRKAKGAALLLHPPWHTSRGWTPGNWMALGAPEDGNLLQISLISSAKLRTGGAIWEASRTLSCYPPWARSLQTEIHTPSSLTAQKEHPAPKFLALSSQQPENLSLLILSTFSLQLHLVVFAI